jgi:LuxR family maltose regulon positive regulatory protein
MALVTTKLYVPSPRPGVVLRSRLFRHLDMGLHHKLTLVSAPAGFGKTTLLSEWIDKCSATSRQQPVAWLSLDQSDNDPIGFWRYLIAALQTVDGAIGRTAYTALQAPAPTSLQSAVTAVINDLASLSDSLVLVLDDYHLIKAESIHTSLNFLLDHAPAQFHLVVATREDPPLALSRRRARVELIEIRTADMRFTAEEAREFLNGVIDLDLSAEDIVALENRTEGWITGLQLAALSLQSLRGQEDKHRFVTTFAGDDRYIVDYLLGEVFQRQPSHIQAFLLQTAILERMCSPLCDAVCCDSAQLTGLSSQEILERLESANLFIVPLDNQRCWYRYHRLLADLLRRRLSRVQDICDIAPLYLRASAWCEREGFIAEAVHYALVSSDFGYAADLIARHVLTLFYRSEVNLIHSWLKALPEELLRTYPLLCAVYANAVMLTSASPDSMELTDKWLGYAEDGLATMPVNSVLGKPDHDTVAGFIATFRAYQARFRGDPPQQVIALSRQALDSLPEDSLRFRSALAFNLGVAHRALGNAAEASRAFGDARKIGESSKDLFNTSAAIYAQAHIAYQQGRLRNAAAICRAGLQSVQEYGQEGRPIPYAGSIYILLGDILLAWNDLEEAERALARGLELIQLTTASDIQVDGIIALARLRQIQGNLAEALRLLQQVEPIDAERATAYRVRMWLAQVEHDRRHLGDAVHWAQGRQLQVGADDQYDVKHLTLARVLIAQHQEQIASEPLAPELFTFLDEQLDTAQRKDRPGWAIEALILQALAHRVQGDTSQAIAALDRSLVLAEPEGYVRIFLDEGAPMAALLRQSQAYSTAPQYGGRLLSLFNKGYQEMSSSPPVQQVIEPLTPRQIEVLQLIAAGDSNPEIAQKLFIAVNTVKKHITNIFGKLGVTSRTQAVARARELELL